VFELRTLKAYIKANLANEFIQCSSLPAPVPIPVAKKKHGGLRLYVDYRMINKATVKNRFPLLSVSEMPDPLCEASIFTKMDLHGTYNLIRIKEGDEYITAF
jgi:hypothetical protein